MGLSPLLKIFYMRKVLFVISVLVSACAFAQSPTDAISTARNYITTNIVDNNTKAITPAKARNTWDLCLQAVEALRDSTTGVEYPIRVRPVSGNLYIDSAFMDSVRNSSQWIVNGLNILSKNSGNVGIGVTPITYKLQVKGFIGVEPIAGSASVVMGNFLGNRQ